MRQCQNCGNQNEENVAFCANCGSPQQQNEPKQQENVPQPQPQQPESPQQQYEPQPQQPESPQQQYEPQSQPPPPQQPYAPPPYPTQQQYTQPPFAPQAPGNAQPVNKYHTLGGWLLFFVIANMIGVVVDAVVSLSGIAETITLFGEIPMIRSLLPDNFESALYITLIGEVVGLLTIVFTILFVLQVFQRKHTFLRFYQLAMFAGMFYAIFVGVIPNVMLDYFDASFSRNIGTLLGSIAGILLVTLYMCKSIRVRTYMGSDEYMYRAIFAFKNQPPLHPPPGWQGN